MFESDFFLSIAFSSFQVEVFDLIHRLRATVAGTTTVTDEDIRHEKVEQKIDQGKTEQNADRQQRLIIGPGDGAEECSHPDHGHAQPLWEIFLPPDVATTADKTFARRILFELGF